MSICANVYADLCCTKAFADMANEIPEDLLFEFCDTNNVMGLTDLIWHRIPSNLLHAIGVNDFETTKELAIQMIEQGF